jgi:hypothetical protein
MANPFGFGDMIQELEDILLPNENDNDEDMEDLNNFGLQGH